MTQEVKVAKKVCKTRHIIKGVNEEHASEVYSYLLDNIKWEDGVRSTKNGFTRKAKFISLDDHSILVPLLKEAFASLGFNFYYAKGNACVATNVDEKDDPLTTNKPFYLILGLYLNFYETKDMYTPNHSHKGTDQLIISLGGKRDLNIAKKTYPMNHGDVIIFGSSVHGVPKAQEIDLPRISIATFMQKY